MAYIFLNTLPKSGSVYIRNTLTKIINAKNHEIGNGYALYDQLHIKKTINFFESSKNTITQNHIECSSININVIEKFNLKINVHVRDPRQAMLSWIHHLDRITGEDYLSEHILGALPLIPEDYFLRSLEQKIDWHIDNYLEHLVQWIRKWVNYATMNKDTVLLTEYNELKEKPVELLNKILSFFDFQDTVIDELPNIGKNINDTHIRSGTSDEWLSVFSKRQKIKSSRMIDEDLIKKFNWYKSESIKDKFFWSFNKKIFQIFKRKI